MLEKGLPVIEILGVIRLQRDSGTRNCEDQSDFIFTISSSFQRFLCGNQSLLRVGKLKPRAVWEVQFNSRTLRYISDLTTIGHKQSGLAQNGAGSDCEGALVRRDPAVVMSPISSWLILGFCTIAVSIAIEDFAIFGFVTRNA
jgi:hypothetical protein